MGLFAILSNDKFVETAVNVVVSVIAFLILFFGYPTETPIVIEIPFETAIPANTSFCKSNEVDKSKTTKGIITTTTVYAAVNFTNKLTYPATWTNMTDGDRCPELYPIALGPTDLAKGGWGLDAEDEADREKFIKLFSDNQVATVKAMGDPKKLGVGTDVWTVEKFAAEAEYQNQFDVCLTAKTTVNATDYEWYYYSGDCTTALYIIGKNSVIVQESVNVKCANPDLSSNAGNYEGDLGGILDPLESFDKLFKQAVVECTSFENSDPQKVFGIALGYGSLVAGAVIGLKGGLKNARDNISKLKKGGVKEVGSMVAKADVADGN